MQIEDEHYKVYYRPDTNTVSFHGSLRMNDLTEFNKIKKFMREAYDLEGPCLILDYMNLEFMNSAGISTLCKFIFDIKDETPYKQLTIVGNADILWQQKSFDNMKKIWDKIAIRFERLDAK